MGSEMCIRDRYMYWMDFYNGISSCGFFVCSINFSLFFPATTPRATTPHVSHFSGYHAEGYHARTDTFKLTGYHVCRVTTPELPRSEQTSGYRRVITPAGSFSYFSFHRLIRQGFHNNNKFSTEPGAHHTDPLNTLASSNNSEASLWMVARPCVGPDLLYKERLA